MESGKVRRQLTPISYHRDTPQAVISASRALFATLAGCAFWVVTAWPTGSTMLTGLIPICALLGTTDRPDIAALGFLRGVALSGVVAFFCIFFLLIRIEGFPLLALVISTVVIIAALFVTLPKHTGSATAFMIFFSIFLSPGNPTRYDPAGSLNTISAIVLGSVFAIAAFRVLWPVVPEQVARRVMRDVVADLAALCRHTDIPPITQWESRMADRIGRLSTRLAQSPHRLAAVEGGLAATQIGREVMRSRRIRSHLHLPADLQASIVRARASSQHLASDPDRMAAATAEAARDLLAAATAAPSETGETRLPPEESCEVLRVAAAFQAISELLIRHRAFFHLTVLDEPPPVAVLPARAEAA
ncbi:MAG: FUSC family protein [Aliidongia sp.]